MYLKITKGRDNGITTENISQCEAIEIREVSEGQPSKPVHFDGAAGLYLLIREDGTQFREICIEKEAGLTVNVWLMNDNGKTIDHHSMRW